MSKTIQRNTGILQFTSVSSMRSFTGGQGLKDDEPVLLILSDESRTYAWDASSSAADDGVDVIKITSWVGNGRFILRKTNAANVDFDPAGTGSGTRSVEDKLRESVSVKDFGAVGDGVANDTTAFSKAISDLSSGDILHAHGSYLIDIEQTWTIPDDVTLDFTGATFTPSSTDNTAEWFTIRGADGSFLDTKLTADVSRFDTLLPVASATGVVEGDLVVITSREFFDKESETAATIETGRVSYVDGTDVYLDAPLLVDFTAAAHQAEGGTGYPDVSFYKTAKNVTFKGGKFQIDEKVSRAISFVQFDNLKTDGIRMYDPYRHGINVRYCSNDSHRDLLFERAGVLDDDTPGIGADFGYGILHTFCCHSSVRDSKGKHGWHSFEATHGQRDITYYNCESVLENNGFSTHEDCISVRYVNCKVDGYNGISARGRYVSIEGGEFNGNAAFGDIITWGVDNWELSINGVTFGGECGARGIIRSLAAERPTNATIIANRRLSVEGCKMRSSGGSITLFGGAQYLSFRNNEIYVDSTSTGFSKLTVYVFANGEGVIDGNTFINSQGSGAATLSLRGASGATAYVTNNKFIGVASSGTADDIIYVQDAIRAVIDDNIIDKDLIAYCVRFSAGAAVLSMSKNTMNGSTSMTTVLRADYGANATITRFVGNCVTKNVSAYKTEVGTGTITTTKDFYNVWNDTV